ncbi:hypothetical protein HN709_01295 [Candidatus Peregrinibacteria bacterium]|jgi:hypothetical protein|nr:hypothetical protein [Candidatus Peregrinibacteria bacterium]MBT7736299.1 hypothetical protein [Candidatus Peregrinibacteria bacterium]
MLKRLFTSNTRIKLLEVFILNPGEEFFIRELTRKLDEQINSVRRELDNLKKAGFLKAKTKNRKKYYAINDNFIYLDEFKSIILKAHTQHGDIFKNISKIGNIKLLVLAGQFVERDTDSVDMLIVGEIDKEKLGNFLNNELSTKRPVKFATMSEEDYKYRISCKDKFVLDLVTDSGNQIPINKI